MRMPPHSQVPRRSTTGAPARFPRLSPQQSESEEAAPSTETADTIAQQARKVVLQLEAKWDAQINALQTTGSLDLREPGVEADVPDEDMTTVLNGNELNEEIRTASGQASDTFDISKMETKRLPARGVRPSYRSTFPMALEENRTRSAPEELHLEDLPTTVVSAITAAAQSYPAGNVASIPSEIEFDDFIITLKHTAQLSVPQRVAIVEFAYGSIAANRSLPYFIQGAVSLEPTVILPSARVSAARHRLALTYHWATIAVLLVFIGCEIALILSQQTGPFGDEAIYIFAGMRTIEGYGLSDNYLTWFAGSLLWPVVSASGYIVGGLVGARLIALACTSLAIFASAKAARNLFGEPAQLWTALALVVSGPVIYLAHLAVYDQLALAGVAISFWAVSRVGRRDERRWLLVAVLAFAVAVIAKYPMILCLTPLVGVVFTLRRKRAQADLFILLSASIALLLIYVLPLRDQLVQFLLWRQENNPSFGATTETVHFSLLWYGALAWLVAGIAAVILWVADRNKRLLIIVLIGGLLLWPAYHFIIDNVVSEEKHQVFGFLFGYPLIGAMFAWIWLRPGTWRWLRRGVVIVALLAMAYAGIAQAMQMDRGWPDTRPAAQYLATHVRPGQPILASDAAPYQMTLYRNGNLQSPWDIYDTYRVAHGEYKGSLCSADWFVDEVGGISWPATVHQQIEACDTFKEVYSSTSMVTQLGHSLQFVTYPVQITVWVNTARL